MLLPRFQGDGGQETPERTDLNRSFLIAQKRGAFRGGEVEKNGSIGQYRERALFSLYLLLIMRRRGPNRGGDLLSIPLPIGKD